MKKHTINIKLCDATKLNIFSSIGELAVVQQNKKGKLFVSKEINVSLFEEKN